MEAADRSIVSQSSQGVSEGEGGSVGEERPREPNADVGVLLVHGIGDHAEGETLLSFGEPLIDWIRDWMQGNGSTLKRGSVHVEPARLRAIRTEPESPAYADMVLTAARRNDGAASEERWRFTEAWWGDSVQAPGALALFGWIFCRGPLLVWWHFFGGSTTSGSTRRAFPASAASRRRPPHSLMLFLQLIGSVFLVLALQLIIVIAALLWLVPIGPWRNAVVGVVRALTLTLGDSYVLLEQEVQRAALIQRVRLSLDWLKRRCAKVVVIAHSQGGAIAHEALCGRDPVALLVTVGSGLEKLLFLRQVREQRKGSISAPSAVPLLAAGAIGLAAGAADWVATARGWWVLPALLVALGCIALFKVREALGTYTAAVRKELEGSLLVAGSTPQTWLDVHATLDLVPMGASSLLADTANAASIEMRNECSLVTDHVRYFNTHCGFAAWLWMSLEEQSGLKLFHAADRTQLERLGEWHSRRAFAVGFGTLLAPLAVPLAIFGLTSDMERIGKGIYSALEAADSKLALRVIRWAAEAIATPMGRLPWLQNDAASVEARGQVVLAFVIGLAGLAAWWSAVIAVWRLDGRSRWLALCRGSSLIAQGRGGLLGWPMVAAWFVVAAFPFLAMVGAIASPDGLSLGTLGRGTAALLAVLLAGMGGLISLAEPWIDDEVRDASKAERIVLPIGLAWSGSVALLIATLLWSTFTGEAACYWLVALLFAAAGLSWTTAGLRHSRARLSETFAICCAGAAFGGATAVVAHAAGWHLIATPSVVFGIVTLALAGWRQTWCRALPAPRPSDPNVPDGPRN